MGKTVRDEARPIIASVIMANEGKTEKEIRMALREAFPWGIRKYHPYKIWLDEIRIQLGKCRFGVKIKLTNPNQIKMFDEDPDMFVGGFDY